MTDTHPVQPESGNPDRRLAPVLTGAEAAVVLQALQATADEHGRLGPIAAKAASVIATALRDEDTVLAVVSTDAPALIHYDTVGSFTMSALKDEGGTEIPYDIVLSARVGAGTVPLSFGATIGAGGQLHVDSVQIDRD